MKSAGIGLASIVGGMEINVMSWLYIILQQLVLVSMDYRGIVYTKKLYLLPHIKNISHTS